MNENEVTRKLLSMVQNGDITAEEGLRLMNSLPSEDPLEPDYETDTQVDSSQGIGVDSAQPMEGTATEVEIVPMPIDSAEANRLKQLKKWWFLPFGIGLLLTVISAIWMFLGYSAKGFGWGFWLSWFPFVVGIAIMAISAMSSKAKWLHIRVHEKGKGKKVNVNISMPIPLGGVKWFFKNFGHKINKTKDIPVEAIISELENGIGDGNPLYVKVDDDGDDVEIFIG